MSDHLSNHQNKYLNKFLSKQAFFERVWSYVRQVPHGKVVTYGQISASISDPLEPELLDEVVSIARLVGSAMAACPDDVPWHRVINTQGRVSNRADADKQIKLLETEGLSFLHGRIDLNNHQWFGPNEVARPKQEQLF